MKVYAVIVCTWSVLLAGCAAGGYSRPDAKAVEIIRKMEEMYADLSSYSDVGELLVGDPPGKIEFRTLYKSPGKLYFEYKEGDGPPIFLCAAGKKDSSVKGKVADRWLADFYWEPQSRDPAEVPQAGEVDHGTLDFGIARFAGPSRATAYFVPKMLFPRIEGFHLHNIHDAKLLRKEIVGGEECFVIGSEYYPLTLWISTKTYALRKMLKYRLEKDEVTIYSPVLNPNIDDKAFIFKAPPGAKPVGVTRWSEG